MANVTKSFQESASYPARGFAATAEIVRTNAYTSNINGVTHYMERWEISRVTRSDSKTLTIDLSDIPPDAVIDDVNFAQAFDMGESSSGYITWCTFPDIESGSGSTNERIKAYLSQTPRPTELRVTMHISAQIGHSYLRDYKSDSSRWNQGTGISSATFLIVGASLRLNVTYSENEQVATVSYGANNAYQKCNVYYGTGNEWKKCKAYYGSGGQWVECK